VNLVARSWITLLACPIKTNVRKGQDIFQKSYPARSSKLQFDKLR